MALDLAVHEAYQTLTGHPPAGIWRARYENTIFKALGFQFSGCICINCVSYTRDNLIGG